MNRIAQIGFFLGMLLVGYRAHADMPGVQTGVGDGWQTRYMSDKNACLMVIQSSETYMPGSLTLVSYLASSSVAVIIQDNGWAIKMGVPLYVHGYRSVDVILNYPTNASSSDFTIILNTNDGVKAFVYDINSGVIDFREGSDTASGFILPLSNPRSALIALRDCINDHLPK